MSDTPRTDAFYSSDCGGLHPTHARFARQLERDLSAATARAEKAEEECKAMLAAGGYDYMRSRVADAESREHNARFVCEQEIEGRKKAEAENASLRGRLSLAQHHATGRHGDYTRALEERDALRKALELASYAIDKAQSVGTVSAGLTACSMLRGIIDAALASTAKQDHIGERAEMMPASKPRTCGECADYYRKRSTCVSESTEILHVFEESGACPHFQPRADAQKGTNT